MGSTVARAKGSKGSKASKGRHKTERPGRDVARVVEDRIGQGARVEEVAGEPKIRLAIQDTFELVSKGR